MILKSNRALVQIFLPFAFGYYFSYLYRSVNAVIAPDLVEEFHLSAHELGLLTSVFFLTFAAIQVPVGMMLDRYGPRLTNSLFLIVGALGATLFSISDSFFDLICARALIGAGFAAALMSSFKVFSIWFPENWLPVMNGSVLFCGGLGAISATLPVLALLEVTDWRGMFLLASLCTVAVAVSMFFLVPEKEYPKKQISFVMQVKGVGYIFTSRLFWRIATASTLLQGTNLAVQTLWAAPWLMDVAGLSLKEVGGYLLILGIFTMFGFLFWGGLATRLLAQGVQPLTIFKWGGGIFLIIQIPLVLNIKEGLVVIWACYGFFGTVGSLAYIVLSRGFSAELGGRVNTALNLLVFLGAFAIQWGVGAIVNYWPNSDGDGYSSLGYSIAFGFFLFLQLPGYLWVCLTEARAP